MNKNIFGRGSYRNECMKFDYMLLTNEEITYFQEYQTIKDKKWYHMPFVSTKHSVNEIRNKFKAVQNQDIT